MLRTALLAVVMAAPSHAAPPASPLTFESILFNARRDIVRLRESSLRTRESSLASRLDWLSRDVREIQRSVSRLRDEMTRLRRRLFAGSARGAGPDLSFEVRRLAEDFQDLAHDLSWKLQDARVIRTSMPEKSADLAVPAANLAREVFWLSGEQLWLDRETRDFVWNLRTRGYFDESVRIEMAAGEAEVSVAQIKTESDLISAKTR